MGDENSGLGRNHKTNTYIQYVILVGIGAIPSIGMIYFSWRELGHSLSPAQNVRRAACPGFCRRHRQSERGYSKIGKDDEDGLGLTIILRNKGHWYKLIGTGVSWALYDFVYYGTAFNQPEILASVLGDSEDLVGVSWRDALVAMMGYVYHVAVLMSDVL